MEMMSIGDQEEANVIRARGRSDVIAKESILLVDGKSHRIPSISHRSLI